VRLAREELAAQDATGRARQVDAPARGARLQRDERAVVRAVVELDRQLVEVDISVAEREQLALPESRERGEQDHVAVRRNGVGSELLHLRPSEEAHLALLAPRRLDAEDALVDE